MRFKYKEYILFNEMTFFINFNQVGLEVKNLNILNVSNYTLNYKVKKLEQGHRYIHKKDNYEWFRRIYNSFGCYVVMF